MIQVFCAWAGWVRASAGSLRQRATWAGWDGASAGSLWASAGSVRASAGSLRLIGAGDVAAGPAVADADAAWMSAAADDLELTTNSEGEHVPRLPRRARGMAPGRATDRIVRFAQQQIDTGLGGSPGNQGTSTSTAVMQTCSVLTLPKFTADQERTMIKSYVLRLWKRLAGVETGDDDDCLDHGPEAVTGPSTSGDVLGMGEEDRYSRCTWARCSGDCRCGLADDIPERTAPPDPADCCVVSDPFELCTWGACYDECTCRPSSRSQEPLADTTGPPAPVARYF